METAGWNIRGGDPARLRRRTYRACAFGPGCARAYSGWRVIAYFRHMIRSTPFISNLCIFAGIALLAASCAGGAEAPQNEAPDTSSEVISADIPWGTGNVMDFISGAVTYPEAAKKDSVEGTVTVEFTISETGAVTNARVRESLHPILDSVAIATAMSMPPWNPATKDGKAIPTSISIPVSFRLD